MTARVPGPPAEPADQPASVACDIMALINRKMDLVALIDGCRRHARDAVDAGALSVLDRLRQGEVDDVAMLLNLRSGGAEAQAARAWLVEAWRHGEVVDDKNGGQLERAAGPVDRFAVAPRAVPVPDAAAPLAAPPEEPAH